MDVLDSQVMLMLRQLSKLARPRGCSEDVYSVMLGCWKVDSAVRFSAEDVRQRVAQLLDAMQVDAEALEWPEAGAESVTRIGEDFEGLDLEAAVHTAAFAKLEVGRSELDVGRQLGKGAFGVVHMATIRGTEVAVKTLSGGGAEMQRKFLIEARLLAALQHPHVVRLVHVCTSAMPYAMAVELMATDLKTYLVSSPQEYAESVLVDVCAQVASAMEHLAQHRVIHRDLAARNVLVSGAGLSCVKLSDMGMARTLSSSPYYRKTSNDKA
jgi:hypothetical protein